MAIYKRCSRCNNRLPSGTKCDCLKKRHKEYDKYARDKQSASFYNSKEWRLTREAILTLDKGIDVYMYMTTGNVVLADTVHHIDPLKDNWDKRCDLDNLMSLSSDTHSTIEQMYLKDKQKTMTMLFEILRRYRSELKDIKGIDMNSDILFFMTDKQVVGQHKAIEHMTKVLKEKTKKNCIILPPFVTNVFGIK